MRWTVSLESRPLGLGGSVGSRKSFDGRGQARVRNTSQQGRSLVPCFSLCLAFRPSHLEGRRRCGLSRQGRLTPGTTGRKLADFPGRNSQGGLRIPRATEEHDGHRGRIPAEIPAGVPVRERPLALAKREAARALGVSVDANACTALERPK
jgi:hypothetical protein